MLCSLTVSHVGMSVVDVQCGKLAILIVRVNEIVM
jgi:hypothetical protein